ncbi:MAG: M48 family metallopeptidase [Proteobacteria bacterium]|nr:M48 family metallopeptidase [Pseudomonadota bacterium]
MKSRKVAIKGVGEILLERSSRARHINLSVRPFKGVRVAVPYGVSFDKAEEVTHSKAGWIKKHLDRMELIEQESIELKKNNHINHKEARKFLTNRLNELSGKHGFDYNKVFVRNQRTRWGSCSVKNNINLNVNLVCLPEELIDYTILHELVHIRIKNHNKEFWDELDKLVVNAKKLDKKLNKYNVLLL